ncbi:Protein TIC 20-v, chloroplastic [Prunus dulcis]|uniref:Protein TIC 20 n=1 Tax=Prunus dulcis TaxID=3755 RepID=A0A4Y1RDF0_PRUDU|nr:Protein TIC 20-v, chloroplastic [Prunus dulcis]
MAIIVLDVLLIFPDLVERSFNPKDGLGLDALMSLDSTVFLFLLVPRLPIVAEAAERQEQGSIENIVVISRRI